MTISHSFNIPNSLLTAANSITGIPGLPDITQPQQLISMAQSLPLTFIILGVLAIGLGLALALLNFSLKPQQKSSAVALGGWVVRYTQLIHVLQHAAVVTIVLVMGGLLCFTLANRYHFWEQSRFARPAMMAAQLEQVAPQVRYTVKEPYNFISTIDGQVTKVRENKDVTKILPVNKSDIQVKISKILVQNAERSMYIANFLGEYEIKNTVLETDKLILTMPPPTGYALLENFVVEQDGQRLDRKNSGTYEFPLQIAPNGTSKLRVSYQAQGSPRWLYNSKGELLENFTLSISNFKNLDVVSGLLPTRAETRKEGKTLSWIYENGAAVPYPFGAGIVVLPSVQTGILPRLLIFAPAIWLWWLILLYLSITISFKDIAISAGVSFASILTLVYAVRLFKTEFTHILVTPEIIWLIFSLLLIAIAWGLGRNWRGSLAAVICTIAGLILPVLGFLNNYNGLTLSLSALLSIVWLAIRNWHAWYRIEPKLVELLTEREDIDRDPVSLLKLDASKDRLLDDRHEMSLETD